MTDATLARFLNFYDARQLKLRGIGRYRLRKLCSVSGCHLFLQTVPNFAFCRDVMHHSIDPDGATTVLVEFLWLVILF